MRLRKHAESILWNLGVADLLRVDLRSAAEDLVGTTRERLIRSRTPSPPDAAWDVFFYRSLGNDALDYRKKLLREKGWKSLSRMAERHGREEGEINRRFRGETETGKTPFHMSVAADVFAAVKPAVDSLIQDGFITAGEKADDFLRVVLAFLEDPEEGFDSHRQRIVGDKPDGLSKGTADRWWQEVRRYLAYRFGPALHSAKRER